MPLQTLNERREGYDNHSARKTRAEGFEKKNDQKPSHDIGGTGKKKGGTPRLTLGGTRRVCPLLNAVIENRKPRKESVTVSKVYPERQGFLL